MSPCIKPNSKWVKYLKIKPGILKVIEEKVRNSFQLVSTVEEFLNRELVVQALRSTISKWYPMKLKSFYEAKDTIVQQKKRLVAYRMGNNFYHTCTPDRGLISKICKDLKQLNTKKMQIIQSFDYYLNEVEIH